MGHEINQSYNQFAKHFNQAIQNQEMSPTEQQELTQDVKNIKHEELHNLAKVYVDQAVIQSSLGAHVSSIPLIQDSALEADMQFETKNSVIIPTGSIQLKQQMMQKLIETLLKDSLNMSDVSFTYNPSSSSYTMTGTYQLNYLPDPAFSLTLKPSVQNNALVFTINDLQYPGPQSTTLADLVLSGAARVLTQEGLTAHYSEDTQSIAINLNAILHKVTPLPGNIAIDFSQVDANTGSNHEGNLEVVFSKKGQAPPTGLDTTRLSDLKTVIDTATLKNLMQTFLAPDLQVDAVSIHEGKLEVKAKAYSPEVKLMTEGFQLLSQLAGGPSVPTTGYMPVTLTLEAREGNKLYFDSSLATSSVAEAVAKLGPKVDRDQQGKYYINLAQVLQSEEGRIKSLRLTSAGIEVESHLNMDHFLN